MCTTHTLTYTHCNHTATATRCTLVPACLPSSNHATKSSLDCLCMECDLNNLLQETLHGGEVLKRGVEPERTLARAVERAERERMRVVGLEGRRHMGAGAWKARGFKTSTGAVEDSGSGSDEVESALHTLLRDTLTATNSALEEGMGMGGGTKHALPGRRGQRP
ncbi:hypothetical protein K504DRAFT_456026 [Pleomassaria siparia CBS 279.74]|uniref:Uncharacterized protein n=1 Tax=Pleomassaria siparia CBS 279.74 TaxID=1314801 RepID=A0A6G1K9I9_9PLEO|nr:hypothetical protein K504DRAFT_456026 [Pleomassaria siparia CBS 279.74]